MSFGVSMTFVGYARFIFSIGLTPSDFALINVFFWASIALLEIPTGLFADTRGRAWSMRAGVCCYLLGTGMYCLAYDLEGAILGESLLGIGTAFMSGADEAWVTDAAIKTGRAHEIRKIFGTAAILRSVAVLLGGILGGIFASWELRSIWFAAFIGVAAGAIIVFRYVNGVGEADVRVSERVAFCKSLHLLRSSRELKWIALLLVTIGLVTPMNLYWAPVFEDRVGTFGLSGLWVVIHLPIACAGWAIRRPRDTPRNEVSWLMAGMLATAVGMIAMAAVDPILIVVLCIVIHEFGRGVIGPLASSFTQHRVESSYRATYGSLQSLIGRIGFVFVLVAIAISTHGENPSRELMEQLMIWCGVILFMVTIALWVIRPRSRKVE